MRYINLLDKTSKVKTNKCFTHNGTIFFAVPAEKVSRAIGPSASNIKKIQDQLGKKVKVLREPQGEQDAKRFLEEIVSPIKMKSLEFKDDEIVANVNNNQSKAMLIGRNKTRLEELKKIVEQFFSKNFRLA